MLLTALALGGCTQATASSPFPQDSPQLHRAVGRDDLFLLKKLLNKKNLEERGPYGWTPLHFAAIYGSERAAKLLLEQGAQVNTGDQTKMTPLHWAARKGDLALVQQLLQKGAAVTARNKLGMTPLHEARTGKVIVALLKKGASFKDRDIDGMTPLHTAPSREAAQFLIGKGANVHARSKDGRTPLTMPPAVRPRVN